MGKMPAELLRTARARRGLERETAVAVAKTISATLVSYAIAVWVLNSQAAVFAPFAAFFTVQATIYRSVWHAVRYLGAVIIGVVASGIIGAALGQDFWTLVLLVVVTVLVGQWRGFAGYGPQIVVVGLFAFAVGGSDEASFLADLLLTVLVGALTGLAANLVFTPQLRFHDAAQSVSDVASAVHDLLMEIAEKLPSDQPLEDAESWRTGARDLDIAYRRHQELAQTISAARPSDSRMLADCGTMLLEVERLLSELGAQSAR